MTVDKAKLRLALKRAGKGIAAAGVAAAITDVPDVAAAVPGGAEVLVPVLTAALLGLEKYLQK